MTEKPKKSFFDKIPGGAMLKFLDDKPQTFYIKMYPVGIPASMVDELTEVQDDWPHQKVFKKEVLDFLRELADQENDGAKGGYRYMLPSCVVNNEITDERPYPMYVRFMSEKSAIMFKLRWIG